VSYEFNCRIRKLLSFEKVYSFFARRQKYAAAIEVPTLECIKPGHDQGSRHMLSQGFKQPSCSSVKVNFSVEEEKISKKRSREVSHSYTASERRNECLVECASRHQEFW